MPADGGGRHTAMEMTRGVYTNLKIPAKAVGPDRNLGKRDQSAGIFRLDLNRKLNSRSRHSTPSKSRKIDWQPCVTSGSPAKQANAFTT
jgi:hypothetical protein